MGRKYIIEIIGGEEGDMDFSTIEPYTEPDLEQVRKEAYEDGYKTAKVQCNIQAEKDLREVGERHYQKGLSNAWETVKELFSFTFDEQVTIFKTTSVRDIVRKYSASETIEKKDAYEQEKKEIKVGDEITDGVANLIVLEINQDGTVSGFDDEGSIIHATPRKKTGRHFAEIATVLQKMKDS